MTTSNRSNRFGWVVALFWLGLGPVMAGGPCRQLFNTLPLYPALSVSAEGDSLPPPSRALAAVFALTLGPFGGHRLYLGTRPKVPLVYALTFGGFGVLAVVDLAHILFTHDLTAYQESDRIFMWAKPRQETLTRP